MKSLTIKRNIGSQESDDSIVTESITLNQFLDIATDDEILQFTTWLTENCPEFESLLEKHALNYFEEQGIFKKD